MPQLLLRFLKEIHKLIAPIPNRPGRDVGCSRMPLARKVCISESRSSTLALLFLLRKSGDQNVRAQNFSNAPSLGRATTRHVGRFSVKNLADGPDCVFTQMVTECVEQVFCTV